MRDRREVSEVPLSDKLAIVGDCGPPRELSLDLLQNDVRNDRVVQKVVAGLLGKAQPLGSILQQNILSAAGRLCSEPVCQYGVLIRCEEINCTAKH
jgi:hypothetical protein